MTHAREYGSNGSDPRLSRTDSAPKRVLVVDDEQIVLAVTARILRSAGYDVMGAPSARDALQLLDRHSSDIDLVLTDVVMPDTDGRALGRLIADRYPDVLVAYMSAFPLNDSFANGGPVIPPPFISKPFSPLDLLELVQGLLTRERLG